MKYFTLFASMLAVSGVAVAQNAQLPAATAAKADVELQKVNITALQKATPVQKSFASRGFDARNAKGFAGSRAEGDFYALFQEPSCLFTTGYTEDGRGIQGVFRHGGAYVDYTFINHSEGAESYVWSYFDFDTNGLTESNDIDLTIFPPYATFDIPALGAEGPAGTAEYYGPGAVDDVPAISYLTGGSTGDITGGVVLGNTTYADSWYDDPEGYKYTGTLENYYPIQSRAWSAAELAELGLEDPDLTAFVNLSPVPNQCYYMTKVWAYLSYDVNEDVTLQCHIRPVEVTENGYLIGSYDIAYGEATISGSSQTAADPFPVFELLSLDEDGMEVEEPLLIDGAIAIIIDGFAGMDVEYLYPVVGEGNTYNYTLNADGRLESVEANGFYTARNFVRFTGTDENGEEAEVFYHSDGFYLQDDVVAFQINDFIFYTDATFTWCYSEEGVEELNFPLAGGEQDIVMNSLFYLDAFEVQVKVDDEWIPLEDMASPWLAVAIDKENNIVSVSVEATTDNRAIQVRLYYPYVTPYEFTVSQGESALGDIFVDKTVKAVEYYDMMGRKLNVQPENGMFIEKSVMTDGSSKSVKIAK